jgi:hypothetical protein
VDARHGIRGDNRADLAAHKKSRANFLGDELNDKNRSLELDLDRNDMYYANDKIMLLQTGEVLTVIMDFSDELERGIVVKENIGRNLMASEVRAAGHTRQRADAAVGVVPPDPLPPPPTESILA